MKHLQGRTDQVTVLWDQLWGQGTQSLYKSLLQHRSKVELARRWGREAADINLSCWLNAIWIDKYLLRVQTHKQKPSASARICMHHKLDDVKMYSLSPWLQNVCMLERPVSIILHLSFTHTLTHNSLGWVIVRFNTSSVVHTHTKLHTHTLYSNPA